MPTFSPRPPAPCPPPAQDDGVAALARRGVERNYRKGTLLIQEGDVGDTLYIILRGRLRSFGTGSNGREITYGTYGVGEYVGEMSLDGGPRSASVEALEACTCSVVSRLALQAHLADHPEFAFELLAKVIRRARAATLTAKQMALNDVYGRLLAWFDAQAEPQPGGQRRVPGRFTHREIASALGCSREMVSRLLKDLETGGYLVNRQGHWELPGRLPARW